MESPEVSLGLCVCAVENEREKCTHVNVLSLFSAGTNAGYFTVTFSCLNHICKKVTGYLRLTSIAVHRTYDTGSKKGTGGHK